MIVSRLTRSICASHPPLPQGQQFNPLGLYPPRRTYVINYTSINGSALRSTYPRVDDVAINKEVTSCFLPHTTLYTTSGSIGSLITSKSGPCISFTTLHENNAHSSVYLNLSVPTNLMEIRPSINQTDEHNLCSSVLPYHRQTYMTPGLTWHWRVCSSVMPHH
jgi:hypothetical protein